MKNLILTIVATIFVFGMLVLVHEFGHFVTAKMTGMRVDEFAIGFGPKLISTKRGETVYSIRAIPLGGFNDIAGMDPLNNEAGSRGYCEKPVLSRMIVILAGSTMNFILPIVLFFGIFFFSGVKHRPGADNQDDKNEYDSTVTFFLRIRQTSKLRAFKKRLKHMQKLWKCVLNICIII